jgi:uncharacterized protein
MKTTDKEIRTLTAPIELRTAEGDEKRQYVVGYAARFNSESENLGGFIETIEPGAFDSADLTDVRALFNHNASQVLGRSKAGTLKLEVDALGLRYEVDMPETSFAKDLMTSMQRGDIDQSSFAFTLDHSGGEGDTWEYDEQRDIYKRTIKRFKQIADVSIVTYPAYQATESVVAQRGLENHKAELDKQLKKRKIAIELELL